MTLFLVALAAFAISAFLTGRFSRPGSRLYILDHPNERSLHKTPTPRSGGVGLLIGAAVSVAGYLLYHQTGSELFWLAAAICLLGFISYYDDRHQLRVSARLMAHIACGIMLVVAGFSVDSIGLPGITLTFTPWAGAFLSLLFIVWMVNLYNFMDGMDGFAGGMAVIGFGSFALAGLLQNQHLFALANLALCSAALGFLIFNFPPARIFLGDVGSAPLGLLAAAMTLWGARDGIIPLWASILVFSPFVLDATSTLLRRLFAGERIWEAHHGHYYQRLVRAGWGHRRTVLWEYAVMLGCSISGLWGMWQVAAIQWLLVAMWAVIYLALIRGVLRVEG